MAQGKEYERNAKDLKIVQDYSKVGIPQDDIALVLGISKNTLRKHYEKELKIGGIIASAEVGGNLFRMTKTHPAAAIFWKKTRDGWREKDDAPKEEQQGDIVLHRGETRPSQQITEEEKKNGTK